MRPAASDWFLFAAIWDVWSGPGGIDVFQMATVTVEPNADVSEYHHRMPALLQSGEVGLWLDGESDDAAALLRPPKDGTVVVEPA